MITNLPVLYDFCVGIPLSHFLTVGSTSVVLMVSYVKELVGTFNQEKP